MRRLTLKGAGESGGHSISTQKSTGCEQTPGAFCVPHGYVVWQQVATRFFFVLSWFQSRDVFIPLLQFLFMKYLIVSDIHGSVTALDAVLAHYEQMGCDLLLLLGDLLNYGPRNGLPAGLDAQGVAARLNALADRIVCVRGNCDSEVDQMLLDFSITETCAHLIDGKRHIVLTHGHVFGENCPPRGHIDLLCQGHTHLPHITRRPDGTAVLNTGSPTFPKGGNPPTFATYEEGLVSLWQLDGTLIDSYQLPG